MQFKAGDKITLNIVDGSKREVTVESWNAYFMFHKERGSDEVTSTHIETVESIELGWSK